MHRSYATHCLKNREFSKRGLLLQQGIQCQFYSSITTNGDHEKLRKFAKAQNS